jgi:hypothetical protein
VVRPIDAEQRFVEFCAQLSDEMETKFAHLLLSGSESGGQEKEISYKI